MENIIKELRMKNGYTQQYVAKRLYITQGTYSRLESGKIKMTKDYLRLLSELYSVSLNSLRTKEENDSNEEK